MPKIIAIANQKGGVGKTFLVFHLGHFLQEQGKKALLIDLDPQGNLSLAFYLLFGKETPCNAAYIFEKEKIKALKITDTLFLVSSNIELARYEAYSGGVSIYFKLKKALDLFLETEQVDYILIDCPPSLGIFSLSAFVAAEKVIVPMRPEVFSISGLGDLFNIIQEVKENINSHLNILGIVLNSVQERTKIAQNTLKELTSSINLPLLAIIPASIKAEESLRSGAPVWKKYPYTPIAKALVKGLENIIYNLENQGESYG